MRKVLLQKIPKPLISSLYPSNALFDLDATIASSYSGGQLWRNLIDAPADGAIKSAYDFSLGDTTSPTTDDPTFVGQIDSKGAYFSLDGGDIFRLAGAVTATPFLNTVHKKLDHTLILALKYNTIASADVGLFSTADTNNNTNIGISYYGGYGFLFLRQRVTTTLVSNQSGYFDFSTVPLLMVISYDSAANTVTRWLNTSTGTSTSFTYTVTASNQTGVKPTIGAIGSSSRLPNGSLIYGCAMLNKKVTNSEVSNIIKFYNKRHGRTYA